MGGELVSSPSWTGPASTSLLGESRGFRDIVSRSRRGGAQLSFSRRVKQLPGNAPGERFAAERAEPRTQNVGVGGEKTARPKRANGSLRRGLACGKPGKEGQARDCHSAQPASAASPAIQPRPRGTGCRQGVERRDAIQPRRLVPEGLGGRRQLPFRRASRRTEFAIG